MTSVPNFRPNWAVHPGESIADALEEQGISQKEAAERLQVSKKFVNDLIRGRASVSAETATALSRVVGSSPEFWIRLQAHYDLEVARLAEEHRLESQYKAWVGRFPIRDMIDAGWIANRPTFTGVLDELLKFFGIAGPDAWDSEYVNPLVAYRTSNRFENHEGAVSAWLRQGERLAMGIECGPWDPRGFRALLPTLLSHSLDLDFHAAWSRLVTACSELGVAVVLLPAPTGCRASGATFFRGKDRAVLLLSTRHKTDDHLWFSFFHEAGHLILHSKKRCFVEGIDKMDAGLETEADVFAANLLIPTEMAGELRNLTTKRLVREFADKIGVSAGIVVGRLQHDELIGFDRFNDLKRRY